MLNTIHLQTFLAVVEAGNYSAAAENAALAQQLFGPSGSRPFSATTARRG